MDIRSIGSLPRVYQEQMNISQSRKDKKNPSAQSKSTDEVVLSSQALELSNTLKTLKNSPEIRAEKIKELSERIDAGAYRIASSEIAESIISYSKSY